MTGAYARHDEIDRLLQGVTMTIKDQIKNLELQVDYIIGYQPSGHPWKAEYLLRRSIIEHSRDNTTLQEIQKKLERLYKEQPHKQGYIYYCQQEYTQPELATTKIKVTGWYKGKRRTYYLKRG